MPEHEIPLDGWVTIRVDGTRMTKFKAEQGETLTIDLTDEDDDVEDRIVEHNEDEDNDA